LYTWTSINDWFEVANVSVKKYVGLVAAYNMIPQNGVLTDISGNGNDGTNTGTLLSNDGLIFQLNDIINLGDVDLSGDFTISMRYKPIDGLTQPVRILNKESAYAILNDATVGTGNFAFYSWNGTKYSPTITPTLNQFSSISFVGDLSGGTLRAFLNGVEQGTATTGYTGLTENSNNLTLGRSTSGASGVIADIKIYNRVLADKEIIDYHNSFAKQVYLLDDFSDTGADGVNKLPRETIEGTGSFKVDDIVIEQGEQVTNGGFEDGTTTGFTNDGYPTFAVNSSSPISGTYDLSIATTGATKAFFPDGIAISGKKIILEFDVANSTCTSTKFRVQSKQSQSVGAASDFSQNVEGDRHFKLIINGSIYDEIGFVMLANNSLNIDNISVTEVPPLKTLDNGTKYLECTSAGTIAIPSKQAYGTWEFDLYKGADGNKCFFDFISDVLTITSNNGYRFTFSSNEEIYIRRRTSGSDSNILATPFNYISINTWYRIKITRTKDGEFYVYIRGGDFGDDDWTLVDVTGGSGTNPVTDTTHTTSNFTALDFDAGDRITNFIYHKGVEQ